MHLRNILKILKITGALNCVKKRKVNIIITKMVQRSISFAAIKEHLSILDLEDDQIKPQFSPSAKAINDLPCTSVSRKKTQTEDSYNWVRGDCPQFNENESINIENFLIWKT